MILSIFASPHQFVLTLPRSTATSAISLSLGNRTTSSSSSLRTVSSALRHQVGECPCPGAILGLSLDERTKQEDDSDRARVGRTEGPVSHVACATLSRAHRGGAACTFVGGVGGGAEVTAGGERVRGGCEGVDHCAVARTRLADTPDGGETVGEAGGQAEFGGHTFLVQRPADRAEEQAEQWSAGAADRIEEDRAGD